MVYILRKYLNGHSVCLETSLQLHSVSWRVIPEPVFAASSLTVQGWGEGGCVESSDDGQK